MNGGERQHAGALVIMLVMRDAGANGRSGVGADDVEGAGAFAVAVAAFDVAIAVGGGVGIEGVGDIDGGIGVAGAGGPDGAGIVAGLATVRVFAVAGGVGVGDACGTDEAGSVVGVVATAASDGATASLLPSICDSQRCSHQCPCLDLQGSALVMP